MVEWLRKASSVGQITLLDNNSTYPPLLEYYEEIKDICDVRFLGKNLGSQALWKQDDKSLRSAPFIYTDPDILPDDECPYDLVDFLVKAALAHSADLRSSWNGGRIHKIGPGLKITDIPDCYALKDKVIWWESQFWKPQLKHVAYRGVDIYDAAIDTTMALYLDDGPFNLAAVRVGHPYVARHTAWYIDSANPTEEQAYYDEHCNKPTASWGVNEVRSYWIQDHLPAHLMEPRKRLQPAEIAPLSVVIPVIQTKYLYQLLSFIRQNTIKPQEIVVIDNNNHVAEGLLREFNDLNIGYYPQDSNLGVNASWNLGLSLAVSELVSFLNDDIIIPKYFFAMLMKAFHKKADAGIIVPKTVGHPDDVRHKNDTPALQLLSQREGWAFTARKAAIDTIPTVLHTWCGDDYLFHLSNLRGFQNYKIENLKIYHYVGVSTDVGARQTLNIPAMHEEVRTWQKLRSTMK
jgi:hypothetical protein